MGGLPEVIETRVGCRPHFDGGCINWHIAPIPIYPSGNIGNHALVAIIIGCNHHIDELLTFHIERCEAATAVRWCSTYRGIDSCSINATNMRTSANILIQVSVVQLEDALQVVISCFA